MLLAAAHAQSVGGSVAGVVTDANRKPLAGAAVHLIQTETDRSRNALTDAAGGFAITSVPPGDYRVEVAREGYQTQVRRFTLPLDHEMWIEVPLLPGMRTEKVEVSAVREPLRTQSSALGGLIDNREITGLPLDGRDFFELGMLLAGVLPPAQGSAGSVRGAFAVNINGAREDSNNFLLDGVFDGDPKLNGPAVTPPVDAIREFEVVSGAYDASFGRNSGGQFNVAVTVRREQISWRGLRVLPQRRDRRAELLRSRRRGEPAIPAQPVRDVGGRSGGSQPHVLLRGL